MDFFKHPIDAAILIAYLVLSFLVGIFGGKLLRLRSPAHADGSEADFYLAGRKVPGWLAGTSVGVTSMNADVAPAYAGMAVVVGLPIAWFYMSRFGLALLLGAILFAYRWRRLGIQTGPEFFALRFGGTGGRFVRVWQSVYGVGIGMVPWIGAGLLGVHKIFAPVFGYEEIITTLILVLPVMMLYVWMAGYSGVLATDLVQSIIILLANVAAMIMVLLHFGGPTGLADAIWSALPAESSEVLSPVPIANHDVLGLMAVLPWFLIATIGFGGNMHTEGQRVFSCLSARESMKSFIWSEIVLFTMLLTLTLPVLGLLPGHPELYRAEPSAREGAYGLLLTEFMPTGLLGLALAALSAAVMSTISSHLNYGAQTLVNDTARTFFPKLDEKQGIRLGKVLMLVIMGAAVAVAYNSESLIGIAIVLGGFFASTVTFAWGQWWWWRANFPAWVAAMVGGPLIYAGLGPLLSLIPAWTEFGARGAEAAQTLGLLQAVLGMVVSTVVWVSVALLTKPQPMPQLIEFYRRARPMGAWGPVREAIAQVDGTAPSARPMIVPGFLVALHGTAWIGAAVVAISMLYVGQWIAGLVTAGAAVVLALTFRGVFEWYYRRLEEGDPEASASSAV